MVEGLTGQDRDRRLTQQCVVGMEAAKTEKLSAEKLATEKQAGRELSQTATPGKRERRAQSRHEVDTSAVILLINAGSRLQGRIHDLSLSGCRIRTNERFPVGIYTRVETEFRLEGLTFRLGGVIQAVHDRERQSVGIRFLDMSDRKREQMEQLIEDIKELRARQALAKSEAAGATALEA